MASDPATEPQSPPNAGGAGAAALGVSTVLERFRRTREKQQAAAAAFQEQRAEDRDVVVPEAVVAEGLSALPQPEPAPEESTSARSVLDWPVEPEFVDPESRQPFTTLGVSDAMAERLAELGFAEAFAVQTVVIPTVLEAQRSIAPDPLPTVLVNSFTGSGKTLAYTVPIVDLLRTRRIPRTRALILLPTKVLVSQVVQVLEQLSRGTGLRVTALRSDRPLHREAQTLVTDVPDIIVSAPGRLVDHLALKPDLLEDLRFLVVDEADRLVGQSFQNWTEALARAVPMPTHPTFSETWQRPPQRLVFSATLTRDAAKLRALQVSPIPVPPRLFIVGARELDGGDEFALPTQLAERVIKVRSLSDKPLVLTHELYNASGRVLVFVRSNEAAARLARLITLVSTAVFAQPIETARVSGEMRPQDRRRVLRDFAAKDYGVLVCTDLIARGIDMPISVVVNYDAPLGAREYVHRVGRTARAGASGSAWTFLAPGTERKHFASLQQGISRQAAIEETEVAPEVDAAKYEAALEELGREALGL